MVPVWGFATVEESTVEALSDGERLYGFLPMAGHLVVQPVSPPGGAVAVARSTLEVTRTPGLARAAPIYEGMVAGSTDPSIAHVITEPWRPQ